MKRNNLEKKYDNQMFNLIISDTIFQRFSCFIALKFNTFCLNIAYKMFRKPRCYKRNHQEMT